MAENNLELTRNQKEVELFFGPNHPGMHGNFSVHLKLEGDTVVQAEPVPGFLHRGFEKLMERRLWMSNLALIPRICVPEPDINEMVYAMAVERLSELQVPPRGNWIRVLILELARINAHLMSIGGLGGASGLYTDMYWAMTERDWILDIFEKITGARVYHMYIVIGGVRQDLPEGIVPFILERLDGLERRLKEFHDLLYKNPVLHARLKDRLILNRSMCEEMCITGIGLRATGIPHDIRRVDPYAAYEEMDFDIPTGEKGDALTRGHLKLLEVEQSIRIIRQVLAKIPSGPVRQKPFGNALRWRVPAGETFEHVESSRGEYGYYVVSDGSEKPYRIHVRGASYPQGLYGVQRYMPGTRIEDVALWLGTMDFCPPEIDR
ncbi:MAG TPA: NADH-quinone oxidoreductase subunit D [Thermotogota bacterium]|nr:NADH-quinone oxidoreductase subunit D [Thermotogota bacterium]